VQTGRYIYRDIPRHTVTYCDTPRHTETYRDTPYEGPFEPISGIWQGVRWLYSDFKPGGVGRYVIAQATGEVINT